MSRHISALHRFWLVPALLLAGACGQSLSTEGGVQIRVENASTFPMGAVLVSFPGQSESYGSLAAGAQSDFRSVSRAYRYAYVEAVVQGAKIVQQPIDYVGESLLSPGRYTYVVTIAPGGSPFALSTSLRKE